MALVVAGGALAHGATLAWGDGVNLQPSYYNGGEVDIGWSFMRQQTRIQTVRIEIEPTVPIATVQRWLEGAKANGYRIIATYHRFKANGSDDRTELLQAARWWRTHFAELNAVAPVVVNVMNEWGSHRLRADAFAAAYNEALAIIREVYAGPVIVDVPGWAQEVHVAAAAARLIRDPNIVFSVHLYGSAWVEQGAGRWMQARDLDALEQAGRPVLVGEFGAARAGHADWSALVDHARRKGWTLLAWAWNGDGEGMNLVEPYWGDTSRPTSFRRSPYFHQVYWKLRAP
jgi:hypothetical protein